MSAKKVILGLVGSPNPDGLTNQLVSAALDAAQAQGAEIEKIQMSEFVIEACNDCLPWTCHKTLECKYDDENFEFLSQKILNSGALILGSPVYWWDTSAMVKLLILKMFRLFAMSGPANGLPALGFSIAGGTGNGLVSGLKPLYHFFQIMGMRAIAPVPATRFNFDQALAAAKEQGAQIASMLESRTPFKSLEERLLHYDGLPYIGDDHAAELRLLAGLTADAVVQDQQSGIEGDLEQADTFAASGQALEAMTESRKVYQSSVRLLASQ